MRSFASDNNAGVHPRILQAITEANSGDAIAYGDDPYTPRAVARFREIFKKPCEVFFVFNGTGANVLGLKTMTESFNSIICTEMAHIQVDECGAPERFTGCKLLPVAAPDGKLTIAAIEKHRVGLGDCHHSQPRVISITQSTEVGTVYTLTEIRELADYAHRNGMLLHMDGARIANAAASLGLGLAELTDGVDVLSFGGTKNGLLLGEAVVFLNPELARTFQYLRKQGMQLASKMRYISAQFLALFENDLWLENARHANRMAKLLESRVRELPRIELLHPVQANAIFAKVPSAAIPKIQERYFFYEMGDGVRWMTSFSTTEEDVEAFVATVKSALAGA